MTNQDSNTSELHASENKVFSSQGEDSSTENNKSSKKKIKLIISSLIGLLLIILLVLFLLFDPLGFVSGFYQESSIVPRKAIFYTNVDLYSFLDQNVEDTLAVFSKNSSADINSRIDNLKEFDKAINEDFGISFNSDIKPWIGKSAAFYIYDPKNAYPNDLSGCTYTLILKVNNVFSADKFAEKIKSGFISKKNGEVAESNYRNTNIISFKNKEKKL